MTSSIKFKNLYKLQNITTTTRYLLTLRHMRQIQIIVKNTSYTKEKTSKNCEFFSFIFVHFAN